MTTPINQIPPPVRSRSEIRRGVVFITGLSFVVITTPAIVMYALGFGSVGSSVGLAGLGAMVATLTLGWRGGLIAALVLGAGAALLTLTSTSWWAAATAMALVALIYGLSSRWGWQGAFVSSAIALSFVGSDGLKTLDSLELAAIVLGASFFVWGLVSTGLTYLVVRKPIFPVAPQPLPVVAGYVVMLVLVTFVTQSLATGLDMGHTGAWLVMTPFIVIMPHIHDGFRKSLMRAAGTVVGFLIVIGVALISTSHPLLYVIATLMFTAAIYAKFKRWNYFYYALFLTPAVVILEGVSTSVTTVAEFRLAATLGAVAISLFAMGILEIIGRNISHWHAKHNT